MGVPWVYTSAERGCSMERLTANRPETVRKPAGIGRATRCTRSWPAPARAGSTSHAFNASTSKGKRRDISIGSYPAVTLSDPTERLHDNHLTASTAATRPRVRRPCRRSRRSPPRSTTAARVARPDARDAAADSGAVPGASHGSTRRPDRPGAGALAAPAALTRQACDRKALPRLGPRACSRRIKLSDMSNAAGEVIDTALPKTPKTRTHRRALPYADVPAALPAPQASGAGPAVKAAIPFTALTAVPSGEARGAIWGKADRSPAELGSSPADRRFPVLRSPLMLAAIRGAARSRWPGRSLKASAGKRVASAHWSFWEPPSRGLRGDIDAGVGAGGGRLSRPKGSAPATPAPVGT